MRRVLCLCLLLFFTCASSAYARDVNDGNSNWNGGLVQTALGDQPEFPFVDLEKADGVSWGNEDESQINQYGWPSNPGAMGSPACGTAGKAWFFGPRYPKASERSGSITMDWVGCAQITLNFNATISSYGQSVCSGSCRPCTQSGKTISGTNCYVVYTVVSGGQMQLKSVGDGVTDPQLRRLRIYYTADTNLVNACYKGIAQNDVRLLQSCFNPNLITAGKDFGVLRFINVMGENLSPINSFQSSWEQNTPLDYRYWTGNTHWRALANYTKNAVTLSSGAEYTLTDPGFSLTDMATVIAPLAKDITIPTATPNAPTPSSACSGTPLTCTISFSTVPLQAVAGMTLWDHGPRGNNPLSLTVYIVSVDHVGNTITIGCRVKSGVTCSPILDRQSVGTTDTIYFSPMLNIDGTGYVPMGPAPRSHAEITIHDVRLRCRFACVFDRRRGINAGWPPLVMIAYANAIGAHPYYNIPCFAMHGDTDYLSKLVELNKQYLAPGLIPFYEGTDEIWNYGYSCTFYANVKQYWRTGKMGQHDQWYGEEISNVAKTVSAAYGNPSPTDRFKYYRVIDAFSAYDDGCEPKAANAFAGTCQDAKLSYSGDGTDPAYKWVTDAAIAAYYSPGDIRGPSQIALAYVYSISPSPSLIAKFLDSFNDPSGHNFNLYKAQHDLYPNFSAYLSQYVKAGYPIRFTQYEGGGSFLPVANKLQASVIEVKAGPTTTLTVGANAWNDICNTYNLCRDGQPTTTLSGICQELDGRDPAVIAATPTTITVNIATDRGCAYGGKGGTAVYDNAGGAGYVNAFDLAVTNDLTPTNFASCELANFQSFYAAAKAASPVPVTPEFPSVYNLTDTTPWSQGRYYPSVYAARRSNYSGCTLLPASAERPYDL